MVVLLALLLHEISENMSLKVIDHNYRNIQGHAKSLGERCADKEGTQKSRTTGERDRGEIRGLDPGLVQSLADDRHDVLFMGSGGKFRNDSSIILVDLLARYHVGEQESVLDHGGGSVVATRFDSKDIIRHILQRLFIERQRYNYFRQSNGYLVSLLLQAAWHRPPRLPVI